MTCLPRRACNVQHDPLGLAFQLNFKQTLWLRKSLQAALQGPMRLTEPLLVFNNALYTTLNVIAPLFDFWAPA